MAGSGEQPQTGGKEVGASDAVVGEIGSRCLDVGGVLRCSITVSFLYGLEVWVMSPHIVITLGGFHHRVERRLVGRKLWRGMGGAWV